MCPFWKVVATCYNWGGWADSVQAAAWPGTGHQSAWPGHWTLHVLKRLVQFTQTSFSPWPGLETDSLPSNRTSPVQAEALPVFRDLVLVPRKPVPVLAWPGNGSTLAEIG